MKQQTALRWLKDIRPQQTSLYGPKATKLAYLARHYSVPKAFVISTRVLQEFLDHNQLEPKLKELLTTADLENLPATYAKINQLFAAASLPPGVRSFLHTAYAQLAVKGPVSVRSSAVNEDTAGHSGAGLYASVLQVHSFEDLLHTIKHIWISTYHPVVLSGLSAKKLAAYQPQMAVIVQKQIKSTVSGTMFSVNPITQNKNELVIEAVWGLGISLAQGWVSPDQFFIDKTSLKTTHANLGSQSIAVTEHTNTTRRLQAPSQQKLKSKVVASELRQLASIAKKLEKHFDHPQDIEWAKQGKRLYLLQTRPITTITPAKPYQGRSLLKSVPAAKRFCGVPVHPGLVTGRIQKLSGNQFRIQPGAIVLAQDLDLSRPIDLSPAKALITVKGGLSSDAALLARELQIPCVVGIKGAYEALTGNQQVTLDATNGCVYMGKKEIRHHLITLPKGINHPEELETQTSIFLQPHSLHQPLTISAKHADGLCYLSGKDLVQEYLGYHPSHIISIKRKKWAIHILAEAIEDQVRYFGSKPFFYRLADFTPGQLRRLTHGKLHEERKPTQTYRLEASLSDPGLLEIQLAALDRVIGQFGYSQVNIILPGLDHPSQISRFVSIQQQTMTSGAQAVSLYVAPETTSALLNLELFATKSIKGIVIDVVHLRDMLKLPASVHHQSSTHQNFDPLLSSTLEKVIHAATKRKLRYLLHLGNQVLPRKELAALLDYRLASVSVTADNLLKQRIQIYQLEQKKTK